MTPDELRDRIAAALDPRVHHFIVYRCRRWLPCRSDEFHTHHLLAMIPPMLRRWRADQ